MISSEKIKSFGFSNVLAGPARKYTIDEIQTDPLRYLYSLELLYLNFVLFDDQIARCELDGEPWKIFGEDSEGLFGVSDTSGRVFYVTRDFQGQIDRQFCAASMNDFVSLFNMFVSYVFRVRAAFRSGHDKIEEDVSTYFNGYALKFITEDELSASYWATISEMIESGEYSVTRGVKEYLLTDRMQQDMS